MSATVIKIVQVAGVRLAYRELGDGLPVLLRHGWPDLLIPLACGQGAFGLAAHDLGGPVGPHWTLDHPGRVTKLALLTRGSACGRRRDTRALPRTVKRRRRRPGARFVPRVS